MIGSLGTLKLRFRANVVNIKFPRAAYHTIVPSTEELYCLINVVILRARLHPGYKHILDMTMQHEILSLRHVHITKKLQIRCFRISLSSPFPFPLSFLAKKKECNDSTSLSSLEINSLTQT